MENNSCTRLQADIRQIKRCKNSITELQGDFEFLASRLSLIGNEVRLKILFLLHEEKKLCVCDLGDVLEMNVSAISQHLRKMKDRQLLTTTREAQTIYYSINEDYKALLLPFFALLVNNDILVES